MTEGHIGLALSFNSRHGGSPSYFDALALKSGHKEMHCPYLVGGVLGCFRGQPRGSLRSLGCLWIPTDFSVAFWLHLAANTHKPMRILVTPWTSNNEIAVEMALMKGVHKLFVCVTKLCERVCVCVWQSCLWKIYGWQNCVWQNCVCEKMVCVCDKVVWKNVCVWQSCVWKMCVCDYVVCDNVVCKRLCVTKLCDKVLCDKDDARRRMRRRRRRRDGIQNQKQEPHTKMWGKKSTIDERPGSGV